MSFLRTDRGRDQDRRRRLPEAQPSLAPVEPWHGPARAAPVQRNDRDNIRYGRLGASNDEVHAAAGHVGADAFITDLPDGYDTEVGEGGDRLSTGQKQFVSLARAVLADPQILVLDEATSSVDTETERRIQKGIEAVLEGRISLIIAHRLSTIRAADRILVIDRGRVIEEGTTPRCWPARELTPSCIRVSSTAMRKRPRWDLRLRRWEPSEEVGVTEHVGGRVVPARSGVARFRSATVPDWGSDDEPMLIHCEEERRQRRRRSARTRRAEGSCPP